MSTESKPARVLVVDDDEGHAEALVDGLEISGHQCRIAHTGREAIDSLEVETFDCVLLDLVLQDMSGIDVLAEVRRLQPDAVALMITGHASIESAVDAMRKGAADYLTKPVNLTQLRKRVESTVEGARLRRTNVELRQRLDERFGFEGILGHSSAMEPVFKRLRMVSGTDASVLVLGESGTGKELVANAVHRNSRRADGPFVAVNCAALSEGLIESELFGHVKGAFTGAVAAKEGRIVYADGGTLFLDEVGDMPLDTQAKLLRVLETREVTAVGGNSSRKVDIRLVSATNQDLERMVGEGRFRGDLLFRLKVVTIDLPPLRERSGDVPILIDHFVREFARQHGREVRAISPETRAALVRYSWPGNVRELRNVIENMVVLAQTDVLQEADVPESVARGGDLAQRESGGFDLAGRSLAEVEKELIRVNLELMSGNREKTAKVLGIGERTLYRKIKEYGLS